MLAIEPMQSSVESKGKRCDSCFGSGEVGSDFGPTDCPDCGGSGVLPTRNVLVEWRARDIERAVATSEDAVGNDVRWLVAELRRARAALTDIVTLAQETSDDEAILARIRFSANQALGLYEVVQESPAEG